MQRSRCNAGTGAWKMRPILFFNDCQGSRFEAEPVEQVSGAGLLLMINQVQSGPRNDLVVRRKEDQTRRALLTVVCLAQILMRTRYQSNL
jgi:hypothetical protein